MPKIEIPGFVDLQVNGYKGISFSDIDLTTERFIFACKELIAAGTVAFLPTIITTSPEVYRQNLQLMAEAIKCEELKGHILGIHVEGPFISEKNGARGAHNIQWVRNPSIMLLDQINTWADDNIKMLTISAELEGAEELCRKAVDMGITVSLGHQLATEEDIERLVKSGACSLTHLGNGIPNLLHRHRNPLWAGLANDELIAMIITDGHHIPPSIIKTVIRTKGVARIVVVSDAAPIAGLPPGRYNTLGNDVILDENGFLYNPEKGHLVGSSATMADCMNFLASLNLVNAEELTAVGFYNPLKLIGIDPNSIKGQRFLSYDEINHKFVIN